MKLPNGFGSTHKLTGNRRKPWVAVRTLGYDDCGKISRQYIGYYRTRAEAISALTACQNRKVDKLNYTLADVYREFYARREKMDISKSSLDGYRASWLKWQSLSKMRVRDITSGMMQQIIDDLDMSKSSVEKTRSLAVLLFDYAMENDIVDKNYAKFIKLPKLAVEQKRGFTELELTKIEKAAASNVEWADVVLILCYTGFRINELLALTPFDAEIAPGGKVTALRGGEKTEAGKNRLVPVSAKIEPYLSAWLAKKGDYIICTDTGKRLNANNFRNRYYYPALEAMGLPKLTPHQCRHTFANLCERAGLSPKKIEQLMGHSNYRMSKKYTDIEVKELIAAVDTL